MKRLIKLAYIIVFAIMLSGCKSSTREEINPNKLITIANNSGYSLYESSANYDYAEYSYNYKSGDTEIFFIKGTDQSIINGIFIDEITNYNNSAGSDGVQTTKKGDNYSIFIVENKSMYYIISRIGKTFIQASCPIKNKNKLINFIDEIGYY